MAKERNRLKDVVVKRLLGRKQPGMYPDGAGLYLRIRDGGGIGNRATGADTESWSAFDKWGLSAWPDASRNSAGWEAASRG